MFLKVPVASGQTSLNFLYMFLNYIRFKYATSFLCSLVNDVIRKHKALLLIH